MQISASIFISLFSAAISLISLVFARYSWRQANRPLISARITTAHSDELATALNIVVENTGNRPARDVRLIASRRAVVAALADEGKNRIPTEVSRCLLEGFSIPVLANGKSISNGFGHLGAQGTWKAGAEIPQDKIPRSWSSSV
jgi:hypothetical protein